MYNAATIQDEFITLVGWRKDDDPSATLNPYGDLLTSDSGLYFNDECALLTMDTIMSIAPKFSTFTYSAWASGTTYAKGDIVTSGGNYYVSVVNANTNHAVNLTAYWRQTTPASEWLRNKTQGGIIKAVNDVLALKFERKTALNLLSNKTVLTAPGIDTELVGDTADFLCWRIVPSNLGGIVFSVDRIALQMQGSQSVTVKLWKNGSDTHIESVTVAGDGTSDVIWVDAGWELEPGNFYYIGFDRSGLTATPINSIANVDRYAWAYNRFPGTLPYAEVAAFNHAGPGNDGWDDVSSIVTNQNSYGINISMTARCDYTQFIIDHKMLFKTVIAKRVAIDMLRELMINPNARINRNEANMDPLAIKIEIDGHPNGRKAGLSLEYEQALKTITFDQRSLNKECLPCKKDGITIGAA